MTPPAGALKGLSYKAAAVRLRTTRMGLYEEMVICSGPRTQALKGRPEQATDDSTPKPSKTGRRKAPGASTPPPYS